MLSLKKDPYQRVTAHHAKKINIVLRVVRRVAVTTLLLVCAIGALGAAYIWYDGRNNNPKEVELTTTATDFPRREPRKASPTGQIGASVLSVTTPISLGDNVALSVRTNSYASCSIKVEYNNKVAKDSGLIDKKANEYGIVSWTWTIDDDTPIGKWPATVTCANLKNSAVVVGDIVVVKKLSQ